MYEIIEGDLLNTDADIICHQVNLQGYMGGGLAYSIARKFPDVEETYTDFEPKVLGEVCFAKTDTFVVANCFSQTIDFKTHYNALKKCLKKVKVYMNENGLKTVAIPYNYGCGIANGDWNKVLNVFDSVFENLYIYKKE